MCARRRGIPPYIGRCESNQPPVHAENVCSRGVGRGNPKFLCNHPLGAAATCPSSSADVHVADDVITREGPHVDNASAVTLIGQLTQYRPDPDGGGGSGGSIAKDQESVEGEEGGGGSNGGGGGGAESSGKGKWKGKAKGKEGREGKGSSYHSGGAGGGGGGGAGGGAGGAGGIDRGYTGGFNRFEVGDETFSEAGGDDGGGIAKGLYRELRLNKGDILMFRGEMVEHSLTAVTAGLRQILQIELCRQKEGRH